MILAAQAVLGAGAAGALALGLLRRPPAAFRALAAVVCLAALGLSLAALPGGSGLVRLDASGAAWQWLFYAGAIPLALSLPRQDEVPTALLLGSLLGMGLLAAAGNLLLLFIGLEGMSLPAYVLVSRQGARGREAAVKYFFAGGAAGALFLLGMSLWYAWTGSLLLSPSNKTVTGAALALMGAAALFKIGAVPLHFWLPDVYEASDPPLAGFLSTAMKAAAALLLVRVVTLDPASAFAAALPGAGAATILLGSLMALRQDSLQRLLAYSSIAHAGNLVLAAGAWAALGAPEGGGAVFYYLAAYLFMSTGAFAFLAASGARRRADLRGLSRRKPAQAALFSIILFALAGIPPTAGFVAKFLVLWDGMKAGLYVPVLAAGLSALISLGYYLGMIRDMYFEDGSAQEGASGKDEPLFASVLSTCAAGSVVLALAPWLLGYLKGAMGL